ncbi:MAG TPA: hypothetical protein VN580_02850 [Clostridia bacterium]|nr:hypothetical protein [Clostridia bacterium]
MILLDRIPLVIGYRLDKALELIGGSCSVSVDSTSTPYEDRKAERLGNAPIVVRQKTVDGTILLTTSLFK